MSAKRRYDLVSLGEPLLRLSPPGFGQLRAASTLEIRPCGAQANLPANLAVLGWQTALLTKLPDNPLGQLVFEAYRSHGVDVAWVRSVPGGKMGLTFVEFAAAPRTPLAIYDRVGSAASTIGPEDFDWPAILSQAEFAYTDGIFPAISPSCLAATQAFVSAARKAGCTVVLDVNYRRSLWPVEQARAALEPLLEQVDILVTNRDVSERLFGLSGDNEALLRASAARFGCKVVCLTSRQTFPGNRGSWQSWALEGTELMQGRRQEFDIVDRYGTGDAWLAGFLYARCLHGTAYALEFANAAIALAHTAFGDVVRMSSEQIEAVMEGRASLGAQR